MVADRGGHLEPLARRSLKVLTWRSHYRVLETTWLDELEDIGTEIRPVRRGDRVSPVEVESQQPACFAGQLPAVCLYELSGPVVAPYSSSYVIGDTFVVERAQVENPDRISYISPGISHVGPKISVISERPTRKIEAGIFLGGNGAFNYYHFVVEILAKLAYIPSSILRTTPFLVPEEFELYSQYRELIDLIRPDAQVIVMNGSEHYKVDRLLWLTQPSNLPFNLTAGSHLDPNDCYLDSESLHWIRSLAFERLSGLRLQTTPSKVFLGRRSSKRAYNQDEVAAAVAGIGFTEVFPEQLSLMEQVNLFRSASFLAGPTGAAWTNLVFGAKGADALYWIATGSKGFSTWANLAHIFGVDIRCLTYEVDPDYRGGADTAPYRIDPESVTSAIRNWHADF